jgi:hypothetical protein
MNMCLLIDTEMYEVGDPMELPDGVRVEQRTLSITLLTTDRDVQEVDDIRKDLADEGLLYEDRWIEESEAVAMIQQQKAREETWWPYEPDGDDYISMERWGHDHWSVLGYLETRIVDNHGVIRNQQMRCNTRLHRAFAHSVDGAVHPTRLREGVVETHDDWSCLEDMVAAGLVVAEFRQQNNYFFGSSEARVRFTSLGQDIALQLRAHKQNAGDWSDFVPVVSVQEQTNA